MQQPCPLCANSGHPIIHSIISSARACIGGSLMASALSIVRLMTDSNLVGCTTGNSAGFLPLRTLPA